MNMDMKAMLNNIAATTSNMDIKMLDIDELHDSAENFFHVDRVEELAESILATGRVKENLIVTPIKDGDGYEIVSGHRRTAAVRLLLEKDEKSISRKLPCMVLDYRDDEDKLIDLIMMNVTQRQMSDADLYTSYKKLNEIFQAKKEKGEKFGKFREKIAEILNVSASQVSKLQNIEKHAVPELKKAVENGEVSISTANEIARLDAEEQKSIAKSEELSDISTKEVKEKLPKSEKVATSGNLADDGNKKVATSGNLADDGNKKVATSGNLESDGSKKVDTSVNLEDDGNKKVDTSINLEDDEEIILPTPEQEEAWRKESAEKIEWANSLTEEQIDFLCDGGWYNNAIRGYVIAAAREADFSNEQINELVNGLRFAFSKKNKRDAEKISKDFFNGFDVD